MVYRPGSIQVSKTPTQPEASKTCPMEWLCSQGLKAWTIMTSVICWIFTVRCHEDTWVEVTLYIIGNVIQGHASLDAQTSTFPLLSWSAPNPLQCLMMPPPLYWCTWDDRKRANMSKHNVFFTINVSLLNPYYYNSPKVPFRPSTQVCIWNCFRSRFFIMSSSSQSPWSDTNLRPKVRKNAFCPFPPSYGGTYSKTVFVDILDMYPKWDLATALSDRKSCSFPLGNFL